MTICHAADTSESHYMNSGSSFVHIVDDDPSARTAVGRVLRAAGYQVTLHESASHLLQNLPAAAERGCILLDVQMPGLNGPQLQEVLGKMNFVLPIIFLTGHGDIPMSVRAIKSGAEDFLSKPAPKRVLLEAVERALKRYDAMNELNTQLGSFRESYSALTPREREVFLLVVRGRLNKQIAHELGTSERTIKAHRHNIMQKFDVKSIAGLVSIAEKLQLLTPPANKQ
jgi:FixJ family two-component response regulator